MSSSSVTVDDVLYSRQLYLLGHEAQRKLATSKVVVIGARGLGTEISKNLVLMGIGSLFLYDPEPVQLQDLGTNFLLREGDIGHPRATIIVPRLKDLNAHTSISVLDVDTSIESDHPILDAIKWNQIDLVIITDPLPPSSSSVSTSPPSRPPLTEAKLLEISDWTHLNNVPFICTSTHGLCGSLFNDFIKVRRVIPSESAEEGSDEASAGTEDTLEFKRMRDSLQHPTFASSLPTDPAAVERTFTLHVGFLALIAFYESQHHLPAPRARTGKPTESDDVKPFLDLSRVVAAGVSGHVVSTGEGPEDRGGEAGTQPQPELDVALLEELSYEATTSLAPMVTLFGGLAAHEAIKALTGAGGRPIFQHFYFDAVDALPALSTQFAVTSTSTIANPPSSNPSRYDSQIALLGEAVQDALGGRTEFIIGAGAVGSEVLKCFALMGVGTRKAGGPEGRKQGKIWVADHEKVRKINLPLQVLYRIDDVGKMKSDVLRDRLTEINPSLVGRVEAASASIGNMSEELFGDAFFDEIDGIAVVVDSITTRQYLSQKSLLHRLPMLEANVEGAKAEVRLAIPNLTESWASAIERDRAKLPKEDNYYKTDQFPTQFEHVVMWIKHRFHNLFSSAVQDVNSYLSDPAFAQDTIKLRSLPYDTIKQIKTYLVDAWPQTFDDCVTWARNEFAEQFDYQPKRVLEYLPKDAVNSAGEQFWAPPKRAPEPLTFDSNNGTHLDFIATTSNAFARMYSIPESADREMIKKIVEGVVIPPFALAKKEKVVTMDDAERKAIEEAGLASLIASLPPPSSFLDFRLQSIDYDIDGDDESNLRIDYITSASRLRANMYGIDTQDAFATKCIAGRIAPKTITAAAVAAGLACLEYYKIAGKKFVITSYKHSDANLSLSSSPIATSTPFAAERNLLGDESWSAWDRIEFHREPTIEELKTFFRKKFDVDMTMVTYAVTMLWGSFLRAEKSEKRLAMRLGEAVETLSKKPIPPWRKYLVVEVLLESAGEDVEAPPIVVHL